MRSDRTLRFAVGTALFALGGCHEDKPTATPEPETTNVGPNGEPTETTNVGPTDEETGDRTNVGPNGEPQPTVNPAPTKSPQ